MVLRALKLALLVFAWRVTSRGTKRRSVPLKLVSTAPFFAPPETTRMRARGSLESAGNCGCQADDGALQEGVQYGTANPEQDSD
jgi:hypothetical protein